MRQTCRPNEHVSFVTTQLGPEQSFGGARCASAACAKPKNPIGKTRRPRSRIRTLADADDANKTKPSERTQTAEISGQRGQPGLLFRDQPAGWP